MYQSEVSVFPERLSRCQYLSVQTQGMSYDSNKYDGNLISSAKGGGGIQSPKFFSDVTFYVIVKDQWGMFSMNYLRPRRQLTPRTQLIH